MSSNRLARGIVNSVLLVGIGVFCWAYLTPTEEEMRKRLKGSSTQQRSDPAKLYGQQKENKVLFDAIKKSAGITDGDLKKK